MFQIRTMTLSESTMSGLVGVATMEQAEVVERRCGMAHGPCNYGSINGNIAFVCGRLFISRRAVRVIALRP
jgi:hypothetical protein